MDSVGAGDGTTGARNGDLVRAGVDDRDARTVIGTLRLRHVPSLNYVQVIVENDDGWFWIDPANDLFFIGMIQRMGGAREGGMNFRPESAKLVYDALGVPPPAEAAAPANAPAR